MFRRGVEPVYCLALFIVLVLILCSCCNLSTCNNNGDNTIIL